MKAEGPVGAQLELSMQGEQKEREMLPEFPLD